MNSTMMKNLNIFALSVLLLLFIQACAEKQEDSTSTISFAIEGLSRDTVRLWQTKPMGIVNINNQQLVLDDTGSGSTELDYAPNTYFRVQIGDDSFSLINTPGAQLMVKGEAGNLSNTITISGKGALPNTYGLDLNAIVQKYNKLDDSYFFQLDSAGFWLRIAALNQEIDSLNTLLAKEHMDPELEALLVLESQQKVNVFILNYALVKRYNDSRYAVEVPHNEELFRSFSSTYSAVLAMNYDRNIFGPAWTSSGASDNDSIANIFPVILCGAIDSLDIPDFARDFYLYRLMISYFGVNLASPAMEEVYERWKMNYPHSIFREAIESARIHRTILARGEPAPIIQGIKPDGKAYSTEELAGKIIYLDVWATWCSACVKKLPKMYALQEAFKGDPHMAFLFVSLDKDLHRWKNYISKLPEGLHINAHNSELSKDYMIGGIPHYILIDASGNIFRSNAPDPDSKEIRRMLEALLN